MTKSKTNLSRLISRHHALQKELTAQREHDILINNLNREIASAPRYLSALSFLCANLHGQHEHPHEFVAPAHKIVIPASALSTNRPYAFYRASCPNCLEDCIRRITDKHLDPYYTDSPSLKKERYEHRIDLLQPGEPGFETYYGTKYKQQQH